MSEDKTSEPDPDLPPHMDDPEQSRRFIETARELGCDEDEERFKERLRRLAGAKPRPEPPPKAPVTKRKPSNRKPPR